MTNDSGNEYHEIIELIRSIRYSKNLPLNKNLYRIYYYVP